MSFPDNTKEKKVGDKANLYVLIKCILVSHIQEVTLSFLYPLC